MPIPTPGLGYKSKLIVGKESSYGVAPASASAQFELVSASITPRLSVLEDPSLTGTQVSRRFIGQGGQYVEATFRLRVAYDGICELWRMFLPTKTRTLVEAGVYDWNFKEGLALNSYCLDFLWGDNPAGKSNRLLGAYATALRISGQAGTGENAMLFAEMDVVAASLTPNTTPLSGAPALETSPRGVLFHHILATTGNFAVGSGEAADAIALRSFDLSMTQPHNVTRFVFGQLNALPPVRSGPFDATFTFEQEWSSVDQMNAAKGNTPTALKLLFRHPTLLGTTAYRELEFHANSPTAAEYGTEVPGFDVITQRVAYRLAYNTSDTSLVTVRARNNDADLT